MSSDESISINSSNTHHSDANVEAKLLDLEKRVGDLTNEIERSVNAERRLLQRLKDRQEAWKAMPLGGALLPTYSSAHSRRKGTAIAVDNRSCDASVYDGGITSNSLEQKGNTTASCARMFQSVERQLAHNSLRSPLKQDNRPWRLPQPKDLSMVSKRPKGLSTIMLPVERTSRVHNATAAKRFSTPDKENKSNVRPKRVGDLTIVKASHQLQNNTDPQRELDDFLSAPSAISSPNENNKPSSFLRQRVRQRMKQSLATKRNRSGDTGGDWFLPTNHDSTPTQKDPARVSEMRDNHHPSGLSEPFMPQWPSAIVDSSSSFATSKTSPENREENAPGSLSKMLARRSRKDSNGATSTFAIVMDSEGEDCSDEAPRMSFQTPPPKLTQFKELTTESKDCPFLTPPRRFNLVCPAPLSEDNQQDQGNTDEKFPTTESPEDRSLTLSSSGSSNHHEVSFDSLSCSNTTSSSNDTTTITSTTLSNTVENSSSATPTMSNIEVSLAHHRRLGQDGDSEELCCLGFAAPDVGCV